LQRRRQELADYNYLTLAHQKGADIRVRHDVKGSSTTRGGYVVRYRDHRLRGHRRKHVEGVSCAKVLIVSAGSLGSTYLMLANQQRLGPPSALGTVLGNGDLLGFVRTAMVECSRHRGPVITSTMRGDELDLGGAGTGRGFYLQDGGYPGFADWTSDSRRCRTAPGVRSSWGDVGHQPHPSSPHEPPCLAVSQLVGARRSRRDRYRCSAWVGTFPMA
jgi:cholesterol oxidase